MIREREHRVPERSLTFTNQRVWRGSKDRNRLAAGLSHAAGMAQQVIPQHCQPGHTGCPQPPSRESPQPWQAPDTGKRPLTDRRTDSRGRTLQEMKPVHHALLLPNDASLPEHVRRVRGCSLTLLLACRERTSRAGGEACTGTRAPRPPARTHCGPHPAVPAEGESTEPARKWSQCLITLCVQTDFYSEFVWFQLPANGSRYGVFSC